jgi:(5-formylfuran-3-yl)methyl phosphate synthase
MTGLLVSVRSAAEAEVALAGGADIVDVKEPRRGALGPADPHVWREVQSAIRGRAITSAALGELLCDPVEQLAPQAAGFQFAKIGLAGCDAELDWKARWQCAVSSLPAGVDPVPVAYADWRLAGAPAPAVAVELAVGSPARLLLIDTHDKGAGGLLDHLTLDALQLIAATASRRGVRLALAGSLDESTIERLLPLGPAYIGVRGAACRGGRDGRIDLARVKSLTSLARRMPEKVAP